MRSGVVGAIIDGLAHASLDMFLRAVALETGDYLKMQIKRLGNGDVELINEFGRSHAIHGGMMLQAMRMLGSGGVIGVFESGDRSRLIGVIVDDGKSVMPISDMDISNAVDFVRKSRNQSAHSGVAQSQGRRQPSHDAFAHASQQQPHPQEGQRQRAQQRHQQPPQSTQQQVPRQQEPNRTVAQQPVAAGRQPQRVQQVSMTGRTGVQQPVASSRTGVQQPIVTTSTSPSQPSSTARTGAQRPVITADPSLTGAHRPIRDGGLAQRADAPRRGRNPSQRMEADAQQAHAPANAPKTKRSVSTNPSDVVPMRPTVTAPTQPRKSHKLRNGLIAGAVVLALGGGCLAAYMNRSSIALFMQSVIPSNENTEDEHHWQIGENESAEMTISTGDTVVEVRKMLYDLGFASTADVLYEKLDEQNKMNSLQAGTYTLIGSETPDEIINRLTSGIKSPDGYIGINVGDTMDIIYTKFDGDEMPFGADDMEKADDPSLYKDDYPMMAAIPDEVTTIEGFIPAGVYDCHEAETAEDAMRIMLDAGQSRFEASGLDAETFYEYLTIGSMIDKEVFFDDEKPLVASVIYNRLDQKMKLGIDATVKYATGSTDARVTDAMTETDSPYNTYQVDGLPIGPICSGVSDSAFAAAQNPAKTDYIYYVLKDKEGHHAFSSDYQQFEKDKDAYLELFGYTDNVAADEENASNSSGE